MNRGTQTGVKAPRKGYDMRDTTEQANVILGFLQNIDDAEDAMEFTRIALDSMAAAADNCCEGFDRARIIMEIATTDERIL